MKHGFSALVLASARLNYFACAAALCLPVTLRGREPPTSGSVEDRQRFTEASFMATHNSYVGGRVGSIREQLDAGVRHLEFDIFAADVAKVGDYTLGHDSPGNGVALGSGNPEGTKLGDWLRSVNDWSDHHQGHAPIVVTIDVKLAKVSSASSSGSENGGLSAQRSYASGNPGLLNDILTKIFGSKLYKAGDRKAEFPFLKDLRNRILIVLSGDRVTRESYGWDSGHSPAVAMNSKGQVIEVHDSGLGHLCYWTGQYQPDGTVRWFRHGTYDTGKHPAVALNNDGWIVEVHEADHAIFYQIGKIGADYEIDWLHQGKARKLDAGVAPSLQFTALDDFKLREVHHSEDPQETREWAGVLDAQSGSISWDDNKKTADAPYEKALTRGAIPLAVFSGSDRAAPERTLFYKTPQVEKARIRYEQISFIEHQKADSDLLLETGAVFCAAANRAESLPWAVSQRSKDRMVRLWGFNQPPTAGVSSVPANYPATDSPYAEWYRSYCHEIGTVE